MRVACILVSIWLQHARRGNAWSHWHQPTKGQFSWHSTELTGKRRVLHSSALLPSQMENPSLEREDNPVGLVWKNSLTQCRQIYHPHLSQAPQSLFQSWGALAVMLQDMLFLCWGRHSYKQEAEPSNPSKPRWSLPLNHFRNWVRQRPYA